MNRKSQPNEIRITRVYDAPVELVWDAWTDPEQVAQWWGPRGFTLTTHSKSLRPGGIWHYTMHGPDGTDYINKTLYLEVEERKKLVYDHGGNDERAPLFRVTVHFISTGNQTTIDMTFALATAEAAVEIRKHIKAAGGNATWDRLAEHLAERACFVINRSFAAPRELVYSMWTAPEHLVKWLPPQGFEMQILTGEIGAGKSIFYRMTNNAGVTMHGRIAYQLLDAPNTIEYAQDFRNAEGNPGKHPHLPVWPATMNTTVRFADDPDGTTRVTVLWTPAEPATQAEIQAFIDLRPGMTQGWTGSFDKLESCLASSS